MLLLLTLSVKSLTLLGGIRFLDMLVNFHQLQVLYHNKNLRILSITLNPLLPELFLS